MNDEECQAVVDAFLELHADEIMPTCDEAIDMLDRIIAVPRAWSTEKP